MLLALAACGRLGYDPLPGDDPDPDAALLDAAVDAPAPPRCAIAGWSHDQPIALDHTGAAPLADHQVNVVLDTASLIAAGQLDGACAEVVFASGATPLPHWLEGGCASASTSFWVRVPAVPPGRSRLDFFHGRGAATPAPSDGAAVFLFFDDFDDGVLGDWTTYARDRDAADGASGAAAISTDFVSPGRSLALSAQAACFVAPFDGLVAGAQRNAGLPVGDYSVDFQARGVIDDFQFDTQATMRFQLGAGALPLLAVHLVSCAGLGCSAASAWQPYAFALDQQAIDALQLEGGAGDCTTGSARFDDVRIRRHAEPEPSARLLEPATTCR